MSQRNDVRTLSDALAIDNQLASVALDRVRALKTKVSKAMQCRDSFKALNDLGGRRGDAVLIGSAATTADTDAPDKDEAFGLSKQWARDLHDDNTQLRATLGKFQAAIDLIMQKHRSQVSQFLDNTNAVQRDADARVAAVEDRNAQLQQQVQHQGKKIDEMLQVMCLAVVEDSKAQSVRDAELERLRTENKGLRQILGTALSVAAPSEAAEGATTTTVAVADSEA
mmetsp:Transcript_28430/g.74697  ORF Transcript_28430/g.74697 Transcript_28430/m.74697 type:complete len:225 (+) Transcript_28430:332-1006(+)